MAKEGVNYKDRLEVGKVYRFVYQSYYGETERIGCITAVENGHIIGVACNAECSSLDILGDRLIGAYSVRLDANLRKALVECAAVAREQNELQERIRRMHQDMQKRYNAAQRNLATQYEATVGINDPNIFTRRLEKAISENVTGVLRRRSCGEGVFVSVYPAEQGIRISLSIDIEKYVRADSYSFLGEEYDCTIHVEDHKTAGKFAEKRLQLPASWTHAASNIEYGCSVGDKNWLSAIAHLEVKCKYTQADLNRVTNIFS